MTSQCRELAAFVRRSANFHELSDELLANVLDLLAGRYPSEEFSELRPRIVWDRVNDVVRARDGSKRLAVTSGGTIPDRGLFGVFLPDGTRVGELDEEMVYESRPGETFLLGASTWRIEDISFERVTVTPAPGEPGKMPFWHGDRPGRPLELGRALGAFVREIRSLTGGRGTRAARQPLRPRSARPPATSSSTSTEQAEATGAVPDDRTIVVERFRDEIGDWRVCILSPFGTPVHAPWAMAIERRLIDRYDLPVETMWGDDGIVIRLPEAADELDLDVFADRPRRHRRTRRLERCRRRRCSRPASASAQVGRCSCRDVVPINARRSGSSGSVRPTCWPWRRSIRRSRSCSRRRASACRTCSTYRRCARFSGSSSRAKSVSFGSTRPGSSPMASSLLFNWIAQYMYEGDAPLAERRAAALALDRDLLRELLGAEELRELLDPGVLADVELELQCLADGRRARSADELHDVLRKVGDLTAAEIDVRCEADGGGEWLAAARRRAACDRDRHR